MSRLTKRFVEAIVPNPHNITKYWDEELRRFGVMVLPSGRRTYFIQYRNQERVQKHIKIGIHGQITAEEARNLAKVKLGQIAHGQDIAEQAKQTRNLPTITELAKEYVERHGKKKRVTSLKEDQRLLKLHILPALGSLKITQPSRREIEALHTRLEHKPYLANRVLALLSKMCSLAIAWGFINDNPVKGIERYQEEKRTRWLNEEELERLWAALERHPQRIAS